MQLAIQNISKAFTILGWLSITAGIAIALYSILFLKPKMEVLANLWTQTSEQASKIVDNIDRQSGTEKSMLMVQSAGQMVILLPEILSRVRAVLLTASETSKMSGKTAEQTEKGIAGLLTPKKQIKEVSHDLKGTGNEMQLLADSLSKLQQSSETIARPVQVLLQGIDTAGFSRYAQNINQNLQKLDATAVMTALPWQIVLGVGGVGAFITVYGIALLLFAKAFTITFRKMCFAQTKKG